MGMALVMNSMSLVTFKEGQGNAVLAVNFKVKKPFNQLYITNNTKWLQF